LRGSLERLAQEQNVVPPERALAYLRNLHFLLEDRFHAGMELYARHAAALGVGSGKVRWAC
jgi:hypothetical protein